MIQKSPLQRDAGYVGARDVAEDVVVSSVIKHHALRTYCVWAILDSLVGGEELDIPINIQAFLPSDRGLQVVAHAAK